MQGRIHIHEESHFFWLGIPAFAQVVLPNISREDEKAIMAKSAAEDPQFAQVQNRLQQIQKSINTVLQD